MASLCVGILRSVVAFTFVLSTAGSFAAEVSVGSPDDSPQERVPPTSFLPSGKQLRGMVETGVAYDSVQDDRDSLDRLSRLDGHPGPAVVNVQRILTDETVADPHWCGDSVAVASFDGLRLWSRARGLEKRASGQVLTGFVWSADCTSILFATRTVGRTTAASIDLLSGIVTELQSVPDVTARVVWRNGSPMFLRKDPQNQSASLSVPSVTETQLPDTVYVDKRQVHILAGGRSSRITAVADDYGSAKLSPDRRRVLYSGNSIGVEVMDLRNGARVQFPAYSAADWFPDSHRILLAMPFDDGERVTSVRLIIYDTENKSALPVVAPPDYRGWDFAVSLDSRTLAFVSDGFLHIAEIQKPK
ncbi:MAG: hypothetical protein QOK37_1759 [Thermoanaerobaculia bacterium]|jgi:WD40 repeat protein|nr:hypothetical protein [Thermoanaerobaculia bacterium]